jgi:hypothetical protein
MKIHFCLGPGLVPDRWPDAVCTATHDRMTALILYSRTITVCHEGSLQTLLDQGPARHAVEDVLRLGQSSVLFAIPTPQYRKAKQQEGTQNNGHRLTHVGTMGLISFQSTE